MRMRHFCIIILFFLRCSQIWNGQYVEWFINRDDIWCRDCSLASTFPRLVRIASNRHALVDDCYHLDSGRMVWDVRFLRPFKDLEMEDAIDFFGFVILTGDSGGDSDLCIWIPSSHGRFDVPSFCRCLWMLLHCHFHGGPFGEQSACQSSFFCMDIRFGKELDPGQPLEKKTLW
ncbi:uncharacterized protein LOC132307338 isoform X3 [Cornus florida]|nr:uncharacterized protein LOC132307338 isoform X3 [Cornus florida]XP_059661048.1 uncharacterized protein LOC132307338 isoform X3 [Cornus florida]